MISILGLWELHWTYDQHTGLTVWSAYCIYTNTDVARNPNKNSVRACRPVKNVTNVYYRIEPVTSVTDIIYAVSEIPNTSVLFIFTVTHIPGKTTHWTNNGWILAHRLRRWPNIKPTLFQCMVIAGISAHLLILVMVGKKIPTLRPKHDQRL